MNQFPIVWRERPLVGPMRRELRPHSMTLEEALRGIEDLPPTFWAEGRIHVNGIEVPREYWKRVRLRYRADLDTIVTLSVPLAGGGGGGGGGGGKTILRLVAVIAIMLVTSWIGGGGLFTAGLAGAAFGAGTMGATLAAAGVGIVGSLALAALSPPPTMSDTAVDSSKSDSSGTSTDEKNPAALSGNAVNRNGSVSRVIGTHKVFPDILSEALIDIVGNDEYIEGVVGNAGPHLYEDIRFNDLEADTVPGLEYEVFSGLPGEQPGTLVVRQSATDQPQTILSHHKVDPDNNARLLHQDAPEEDLPVEHVVSSYLSPDEFWITLNFTRGLVDIDTPGSAMQIPLRLTLRNTTTGDTWRLPEIHFSSNTGQPFKKIIKFIWQPKPIAYPTAPLNEGPCYAYHTVPNQTTEPVSSGWQADSYFIGGGGSLYAAGTATTHGVRGLTLYNSGVDVYLDPTVFPPGYYEVGLRAGSSYLRGDWNSPIYTLDGAVVDMFGYRNINTVMTAPYSRQNLYDDIMIERCASVWNAHPVAKPDFSYIAFRAKNLKIDKISSVASGYIRTWNGVDWGTWDISDNPADNLRFVFTDLNSDPLPQEIINDAELLRWRDDCIYYGYRVNMVVQDNKVTNVLETIAGCGYARPTQTETWAVSRDRNRDDDPIVQIFNPRNLGGFRWEKAFVDLPEAFRVTFTNREKDYTEDEIFVAREDVNLVDATLFEEVSYVGIDNEDEARLRARHDMAQAEERSVFYYGSADFEALVCSRGDLVAVQHEVLTRKAGYARVAQVLKSGNNVTGLVFDGTIPSPPAFLPGVPLHGLLINPAGDHLLVGYTFYGEDFFILEDEPGHPVFFEVPWDSGEFFMLETTGIMIRLTDGTTTTIAVNPTTIPFPTTNTVTFTTPYPDPNGLIAEDALIHAGPLGEEYTRLIVLDMTFSADEKVNLTFVDEGEEMWAETFVPLYSYDFTNSNDGWAPINGTLTVGPTYSTWAQTVNDPQLYSPAGLVVDGYYYRTIRFDVERTVARSSGVWQGAVYFSGTQGGMSGLYFATFADFALGERRVVEIDMGAELTAGGSTWIDNIIDRVRLDFDSGASGTFRIHSVEIGRYVRNLALS